MIAGLHAVEFFGAKAVGSGSVLLGALMLSRSRSLRLFAFFAISLSRLPRRRKEVSYRNFSGHVELHGMGQRIHGSQ